MKKLVIIFFLIVPLPISADLLIPMDLTQTDHLKAYGIVYKALELGYDGKWLLNYRGGSFLIPENDELAAFCKLRGVIYERISPVDWLSIEQTIEKSNMDIVYLEKAPKIAVYTLPESKAGHLHGFAGEPWDDAVTLALTYAEIPYETVYDTEVLQGKLEEYDWLHLHHEDFTGQYGKFYASFRNTNWYKEIEQIDQELATKLGFEKVWQLKQAVVQMISNYVKNGGFLFAMCAATDTYDIAQAAYGIDICDTPFDGDPMDRDAESKLDFDRTFAFENFTLVKNPYEYEFSSIDASNYAQIRGAEADYFTLFDFSAKYDPVPTMLTQCHVNVVNGFLGQTTSYHKKYIKKSVIVLGEVEGADEVKYLHGNFGRGTFTFYGGHDPEDYQHRIGDPPTLLELHKNSPGYRLILNNILFPAAKKKKLKT
ncbi:MAG TPA: asparagine synthetase B [Candidatus Cloacimonetes bacterium]|nr:asparagine synthetase B [Candidatus Cloacimonadota bacterium]HEX37244.1 asparagine synthetase B [Candidatus Cloacimonadota bacterium]